MYAIFNVSKCLYIYPNGPVLASFRLIVYFGYAWQLIVSLKISDHWMQIGDLWCLKCWNLHFRKLTPEWHSQIDTLSVSTGPMKWHTSSFFLRALLNTLKLQECSYFTVNFIVIWFYLFNLIVYVWHCNNMSHRWMRNSIWNINVNIQRSPCT